MKLREVSFLYYPYQIYKIIIFIPFLGLGTAVLVILGAIYMSIFAQNGAQFVAITWARLMSYFTPMFVKVIGKENIDPKQSYIIVSNHQSQYDIFVIYGWLPINFKWVMKSSLRKVPFLGYFCYKMGHVFIDRSNPESAKATINASKKYISGGTSIMFFPEGTRSETGELLPFKKGAFKLALDMQLPVLPLTVTNTKDILPDNTLELFPGRSKLVINKPIPIEHYTEENIDELMDKARKIIGEGLEFHKYK